jgi:hypothetical protein
MQVPNRFLFFQLVFLRSGFALAREPGDSWNDYRLPETVNGNIRTNIDKANWKFAHCMSQCVVVASRPFLVKVLAKFLAFDFDAGSRLRGLKR